MMREPEPETPPTWRSFCGYAIATPLLTLLIVSALAWAEGRPLPKGEISGESLVLLIPLGYGGSLLRRRTADAVLHT